MNNADPKELEKFNALAAQWWDPNGHARPLHDLNPVRADFVAAYCKVDGAQLLDVGCGGGLLSEALAAQGAQVLGIDLAARALEVAQLHRYESDVTLDYRNIGAEALAVECPGGFDTVTCLEMLEHVPSPDSVVAAIAGLLKPGGRCVLSTINRSAKAFALAIVGAEYVLKLLPKGTHEYHRFIRPSELTRWGRQHGLELVTLRGLRYDPFARKASLSDDVAVNYIACYEKACA